MAYTNTENDGHDHEPVNVEIESAEWIVTPTGEKDGRPAVFKEGSATFKHTCRMCGKVTRWAV